MNRFYWIPFFIFSTCTFSVVQAQSSLRFSDSIQISLLTNSPGEDLYAQFAHSIVRVQDLKLGTDLAFNYGTFDFGAPNFYLNFLRGNLNYQLAVHDARASIRHYTRNGQQLREQVFLLSPKEEQKVASFLIQNAQPENREYLYDFFYDNCATRIRDVMENEVEGFSYLEADVEVYTFRQMLDLYMHDNPWTDFGMDLILGVPTDQVADMRDQMFLPDFLAQNLYEFARNNEQPLLSEPKFINNIAPTTTEPTWLTPLVVGVILLIVSGLLFFFVSRRTKKVFDNVFFIILSLAGFIITFMWLGTDHWTTTNNLNVIWASPLFLIFLILKKRKWLAVAAIGLAGFVLLLGWLLPQQFHLAFIPIWLSMIVRGVDILKN
ncbi:MAG: DUF4105 domain-containing protein [Bacteroidota bacterium]